MQPHLAGNRLYWRLKEAMQAGQEVRIQTAQGRFVGIPVHLDNEFVELLSFYIYEVDHKDPEDQPYERALWLIKLANIAVVGQSTATWSRTQFEQLMSHELPAHLDSSLNSDLI